MKSFVTSSFTRSALWGACLLAGLSGCADPSGIAPKAAMQEPHALLTSASTTGTPDWARSDAWLDMGDAQLAHFIQLARQNNPNLAMAQTRLEKAKAYIENAEAALKPKVNAELQVTSNHFNNNPMFFFLKGSTFGSDLALVSASWELDFFGKNRAALNAALGQAKASEADWQAARSLLSSQVARTYWQWARVQAQLKLSKQLLIQREEQLKLTRERLSAGLDTQLELRQAQAGVPEVKVQIEALVDMSDSLQHALGALVGDLNAVSGLKEPAMALAAMPVGVVPNEIPLDLIGRRPDVLAAKWRVEAMTQDMASARAAFYPNVNLSMDAIALSMGVGNLFNSPGQILTGGPAISLPLFDAGRLRANLRSKTADVDAAVASYNGVVLDAVREVADLVSTGQSLQKQLTEQQMALRTALDAQAIAQQRLDAGLIPAFPVLAANSAVLAQERLTLDLQVRVLDNRAALWRALGSGVVTP
jgi:NodT family efflux transporter outer membrane factor (OMF) lipoprotein